MGKNNVTFSEHGVEFWF